MADTNSFGFGARLRAAREAAGLSGTELGRGAGENGKDASKGSVSDWEHERHYPKADQLRVMCLRLNVSVEELLFGDVKEQVRVIQAESAIKALSDEQRALLLEKMGPAIPPSPAPPPPRSGLADFPRKAGNPLVHPTKHAAAKSKNQKRGT